MSCTIRINNEVVKKLNCISIKKHHMFYEEVSKNHLLNRILDEYMSSNSIPLEDLPLNYKKAS